MKHELHCSGEVMLSQRTPSELADRRIRTVRVHPMVDRQRISGNQLTSVSVGMGIAIAAELL